MKTFKIMMTFILVLSLCQIAIAEKRVNPKSMKELTDPASPSYVPYPYPKKRSELIADLKYAIDKLFNDGPANIVGNNIQPKDDVLVQLLEEESQYKISEIVKVKNRVHRMAHDYTWLFIIRGENNHVVARVSMRATGLLGGVTDTLEAAEQFKRRFPNARSGPHIFVEEQTVLDRLAEVLDRPLMKNEIKKTERVAFQSPLGAIRFPMWELKLNSGKTYYYSEKKDSIYEIEDKKSWKKDNNGRRKHIRSLVQHTNHILPDTVNDEIIVLKKKNMPK
jgi:hypothetical protein